MKQLCGATYEGCSDRSRMVKDPPIPQPSTKMTGKQKEGVKSQGKGMQKGYK